MTELTPSQHAEYRRLLIDEDYYAYSKEKLIEIAKRNVEDSSPTVHTYGLEPGESITFPVHQKKSSWPAVPIGRLSTILPMVGIFVYYKDMKFTDQFQVTMTSKEYETLQEMFSFCSDFDFEMHNDAGTFDRLWDKVLDADHWIITEETKWARSPNSIQDS